MTGSSYCSTICGTSGGTFSTTTGTCQCNDITLLDSVCSRSCRDTAPSMRCLSDGNIQVSIGDTTYEISPASIPLSSGVITCSSSSVGIPSSVYTMSTTEGQYTGIYGLGSTVSNVIARRRLSNLHSLASIFNNTLESAVEGQHSYRRRLDGTLSAKYSNAIVCIRLNDSILFEVNNSFVPVYEKDSLLNTNKVFDYSAFRDLAVRAKSTLKVTSFAFTFSVAGTYVFSLLSNPSKMTIIGVMPAGVNCSVAGPFVEFSDSNLIKMGVVTNNNIVLTPDWNLVLGLLFGMMALLLIVVGFLYYFRKRAWSAHFAVETKYRNKSRSAPIIAPSKGGILTAVPKLTKTSNILGCLNRGVGTSEEAVDPATAFPLAQEDIESAVVGGAPPDAEVSTDDNYVPQFTKDLQLHHDDLDRQMQIQNDLIRGLQDSLLKEVDDLKNLLMSTAMQMASSGEGKNKSLQNLLQHVKSDVSCRELFESSVSATEDRITNALKQLQHLLEIGSFKVSEKICDEIGDEAVRAVDRDDHSAECESVLLHEMIQELENIKQYVTSSLIQAMSDEERRRQSSTAVFEQTLRNSKVELSQAVLDGIRRCMDQDLHTDAATGVLVNAFRGFAESAPKFVNAMIAAESSCSRQMIVAVDAGNPSLLQRERSDACEVMSSYLEELRNALIMLVDMIAERKEVVTEARMAGSAAREDLLLAIEEATPATTQDFNIEQLLPLLAALQSEKGLAALEDVHQRTLGGAIDTEKGAGALEEGPSPLPDEDDIDDGEEEDEGDEDDERGQEEKEEEMDVDLKPKEEATVDPDAVMEFESEPGEEARAIEEAIVQEELVKIEAESESLTEAMRERKEQILDNSDMDLKIMMNIMEIEKRRQESALRQALDLVSKAAVPDDDDDEIAIKHAQEQAELEERLRVEREEKLARIASRADSIRSQAESVLDVNNLARTKLQSLANSRYAIMMRCSTAFARIKHHELALQIFVRNCFENIVIYEYLDFKEVARINEAESEEGYEATLRELNAELITQREETEKECETLTKLWLSNTAMIDIEKELNTLRLDVKSKFSDMRLYITEYASRLKRMFENFMNEKVSDVLTLIQSQSTTEESNEVLDYLKNEINSQRVMLDKFIEEQLRVLEAEESRLSDTLVYAVAWGPEVDDRKQCSHLFMRLLVSLQASHYDDLRMSLIELDLKHVISELKAISNMKVQKCSESEVQDALHKMRNAERAERTALQKTLEMEYQRKLETEKNRQQSAANVFEKELVLACESTSSHFVGNMLELSKSRKGIVQGLLESRQVRIETLSQDIEGASLPEKIKELTLKQIDDEALRVLGDIYAIYSSVECDWLVGDEQKSEMVAGIEPDVSYAHSLLVHYHTSTRCRQKEAARMELARKKCNILITAAMQREYEMKRLLALGRSPDEIDVFFEETAAAAETEMKELIAASVSENKRLEQMLLSRLEDKFSVQTSYEMAVQNIVEYHTEELSNLRKSSEAEKSRKLTALDDRSTPDEGIQEELYMYEQNVSGAFAELQTRYFDSLCEAFKSLLADKMTAERVEDELRCIRVAQQLENEALEEAHRLAKSSKYDSLLEKQQHRRDEAEAAFKDAERAVIGLEAQLEQKKSEKEAFLEEYLLKRRQNRVAELMESGVPEAQAIEMAAAELFEDEEMQRKKLKSDLSKEREDTIGASTANYDARLSKIKNEHDFALKSLENGLEAARDAEKAALKKKLLERKAARVRELVGQGCSANESERIANQEVMESEKEGMSDIDNKYERLLRGTKESLERSEDLDAKKLREEHERNLKSLEDQLKAKKAEQKKALMERLEKQKQARIRELVQGGMTPAEAEVVATREMEEAKSSQLEKIMDELEDLAKQAITQEDQDYNNKLDAMKSQHADALAALREGLVAHGDKERKNLANKLAKRRNDRARELASQGLSQREAETQAEEELLDDENTEKELLDKKLIVLKQRIVDAIDDDYEAHCRRIREAHEKRIKGLNAALETKRISEKKALSDRLARRRKLREQELIAGGMSPQESSIKADLDYRNELEREESLLDSFLDDDRKNLLHQKEEDLMREAALWNDKKQLLLKEEEEETKMLLSQMQVESIKTKSDRNSNLNTIEAAREAAKETQEQTEEELKALREKHEKELRRLQTDLLSKKQREEKGLHDRLTKKRRARESELMKSGLSPEEAKGKADEELAAEEKAMYEDLRSQLESEEKQLVADKKAEGLRAESEWIAAAHERARVEAEKASKEKEDALKRIEQLRKQHEDEAKRLQDSMSQSQMSQEQALRDRLAKKRNKRLQELHTQELGEEAMKVEVEKIDREEKASLESLQKELGNAKKKEFESQLKKHKDLLAKAVQAAKLSELEAATAAAREAALEAAKAIKARAQEEALSSELRRKKDELEKEEERYAKLQSAEKFKGKSKLEQRLAAKKDNKERELRTHEEEAKAALLARQSAEAKEKEKLRHAKAIWVEKLQDASEMADKLELEGLERERYCLEATLGQGIVPGAQLTEAVGRIQNKRHAEEMKSLLTKHYEERIQALNDVVTSIYNDKYRNREELIKQLKERNAGDEEMRVALASLDAHYDQLQRNAELETTGSLEAVHTQEQLELRQRQLQEAAQAIQLFSDVSSISQLSGNSGKSQEEQLVEYRQRLERENYERNLKLEQDRKETEAMLRKEHEAKVKQLRDALLAEQAKEEAEIEKKRLELLRQRELNEQKRSTAKVEMQAQEKARILSEFEKESAAAEKAREDERMSKKMKLQNRLAEKKAVQKKAIIESTAKLSLASPPTTVGSEAAVPHTLSDKALTPTRSQLKTDLSARLRFKDSVRSVIQKSTDSLGSVNQGREALPVGIARSIQLIESKLDRIDEMMTQLKLQAPSQSTSLAPGRERRDSADSGGYGYQDTEDPAAGEILTPVADEDLLERETARLTFARQLAERVGLKGLTIKAAKSLPPSNLDRNAFRNSYLYDSTMKTLLIHTNRFSSSGDIGLVVIHALSHIKVTILLILK